MAKEFDIYLNRRIAECDLMVLSLPFRDGLTADNRVILDACINAYVIYKFAASQMQSELEAHIDKMLKICRELAASETAFAANADFEVHKTLYPDNVTMNFQSQDIPLLASLLIRAKNDLRFGIDVLDAGTNKSMGHGRTGIVLDTKIQDTLKRSLLRTNAPTTLDADISGTNKQIFVAADMPVELGASLSGLCYSLTDTASAALDIAALVLGTALHHPFGRAYTSVSLRASVGRTNMIKYEAAQCALGVLASLSESIRQYMTPEDAKVELSCSAETVIRRFRLLQELDDNDLALMDETTLDDLDYVVVEE